MSLHRGVVEGSAVCDWGSVELSTEGILFLEFSNLCMNSEFSRIKGEDSANKIYFSLLSVPRRWSRSC